MAPCCRALSRCRRHTRIAVRSGTVMATATARASKLASISSIKRPWVRPRRWSRSPCSRRGGGADPVRSAGGVIAPPPGYFARLAELCEARGMLLVLDECQTGLGRLGAMYGFEIYGVVPDFLVLSKTLGGGIPIGAVLTSAAIEASCHEQGFVHVTSHVSDPLPAAAARAVLEVVRDEDLPGRARRAGERLLGHLRELQRRHEAVGDVRGMGLMCGLELVDDRDSRRPAERLGLALSEECERRGLSMNLVRGGTGGAANCLRMAPPLTISDDEIDLAADILDASLATLQAPAPH